MIAQIEVVSIFIQIAMTTSGLKSKLLVKLIQ